MLDEDLAAKIVYQARHPRFDRPCGVDVATLEERDEFSVLRREHLRIAASDGDIEAARAKPDARFDVLGVAQLRRGDSTTAEISRCAQDGPCADDQGIAASSDRSQNAYCATLGAHVGVDDRRGADIGHVDRTGNQGLHGGRPRIERTPLQLHAGREVSLVEILAFALPLTCRQGRGVREIREEAHPQDDRLFGCDQEGRDEKSEDKRSHGG